MPDFIRFLSTFREHMNAELTRSDVLRALIWPNAGLLLALVGAAGADAPEWLLKNLALILSVFMGLYAVAYIYFAIRDPDALRSEKYKLQKMAMEQGLYGDSLTGLRKIEEIDSSVKLIDAVPAEEPKDD
jgi:hypothetical protein